MKVGRCFIIGIEKAKEPELTFGLLKAIKTKTYLKFPKKLQFKKMSWACGRGNSDWVRININIPNFNEQVFTIIHELVHSTGYLKHNKRFFRKYINACFKLNLNPEGSFIYSSGEKYWKKYKKRKGIKCIKVN